MPQNFYELAWIFIIYAFIGWCTEVSYAALDRGIFVNRGFLNGPYCPIYGCGVVIVVSVLTPLKQNLFILFIGSVILTSVLEYLTGFLLEKVFHNKWWDYSDKPFNIKGYVCLKFSIYWGLACTFIMNVLHPLIYKGITFIPEVPGIILLGILIIVFGIDCCVTVSTILKFNKRLKLLDEMAVKIHKLSDEIGETIYENVSDVIEKSETFQETHAELIGKLAEKKDDFMDLPETAKNKIAETTETAKSVLMDKTEAAKSKITDTAETAKIVITENIMGAKSELEAKKQVLTEKNAARKIAREEKQKEYEELSEKYKEFIEKKSPSFRRLLKAFPDMTSRDNDSTLQDIKKYLHIEKTHDKKEKGEKS